MRRTLILLSIVIFTCMAFSSSALAKTEEGDLLTSRELLSTTRGYGLANAMTAASSGTTAIWHNPAGITAAQMYSFDASYFYQHDVSGHGFETNVVDMKSNQYVGAGLGFLYEYATPNKDDTQHTIHLRFGAGVPLANNLISLGVSGLYSHIKYNGKQKLSQFSMDAGLVIRPLEWLSLGLSAQNLIVGDYKNYMPRMISAGIAVGSIDLGLNAMFDVSFNLSADKIPKSGSYGIGVEYVLKEFVPLRVGYRYEGDEHHVLSAGIGYRHDGGIFGLDLAYQHHFEDYSNELLSASLEFYF